MTYSTYNPRGIYPNETRTANGNLTFPQTTSPIQAARNNLRYWQDRTARDSGSIDSLREAVAYMIKVIDEETGNAPGK